MPLAHMGPSAAANAAPRSQRVLDALRCIISLIRGPNELFQMKILPVLRKQSTLFTLSWCAGLSACSTMPLRLGVWGPLPQESALCAFHILLRTLPVEAFLDYQVLGLLGCILRLKNAKKNDLLWRQLALKDSGY